LFLTRARERCIYSTTLFFESGVVTVGRQASAASETLERGPGGRPGATPRRSELRVGGGRITKRFRAELAVAPPMVHQFSCSDCAFQVRSEDDDELVRLVRGHADEMHDMSVSRQDVRSGWENVELEADD
jgi:predicted small metal-binding protein